MPATWLGPAGFGVLTRYEALLLRDLRFISGDQLAEPCDWRLRRRGRDRNAAILNQNYCLALVNQLRRELVRGAT